jgi:hypothetical protein
LSRLLTALSLLPSIATSTCVNKLSCRHSTMNWRAYQWNRASSTSF